MKLLFDPLFPDSSFASEQLLLAPVPLAPGRLSASGASGQPTRHLPGNRALTGLLVGALGLASHCGQAQTGERWQPFVGVGGLYGGYQLNHSDDRMNYPVPALTAGIQRGRVGFQASAAYYAPGPYLESGHFFDSSIRQTRYYSNSTETRSLLLPLLVRYGLLPPGRLQVDVVGGLMLTVARRYNSYRYTDSTQAVLVSGDRASYNTNPAFLFGLGLRYQVAGGLHVTVDGWGTIYQKAYLPTLLPVATAGLRYQWNR